jgi:radical SAM superfamily enzyme YgiQ (UPF0313 family)
MTLNPYPLEGMFHYVVLGDGENVIVDLVKAIEKKNYDFEHPSVLKNAKDRGQTAVASSLPMEHYIEERTNKITRIEIARGCKASCAFCQISKVKPYREIPPVVLKNLIATAPTKNIALFSPDRGSYSQYEKIEEWCKKYGKRNIGTDIRLRSIEKTSIASNIRFGIEGFSERERKLVNKPYTNAGIVNAIKHIVEKVQTPKGKAITVITWYMIIGLPGQTQDDYAEFRDLLLEIGSKVKPQKKFTIFLTLNDFLPMPHTKMENDIKEVFEDHYSEWMKYKPNLENITIAQHGGSQSPSMRLARLLVSRGGENSNKALFNLATNPAYARLMKERGLQPGKKMIALFRRCGVDTEPLINGYGNRTPWDTIRICER